MAITTTVYVALDTRSGTITITGGNDPRNDGTVNADPGPGNQITFAQTGSNTSAWQLTGISWTPSTTDLSWAWVNNARNGSILVSDNDTVPSGRNAVSYEYVVTTQVIATGAMARADPAIINRPAPGMTRRMGG